MKIAIIVGQFPPKKYGGTEVATNAMAKKLVTMGHEVHVITSLDEGLPKDSVDSGVNIHRVMCPKVALLFFLFFFTKALITVKKLNPDVIHVQGIINGICGLTAKICFKKRYVVWGRGTEIHIPFEARAMKSGLRMRVALLYERLTFKLVFKHADAVIALTENMKKEIQKVYARNIFVIPNGIDLENFKQVNREDIRLKLHITQDKKIIIFVGRLMPVKGVQYLIEAMSIIAQKEPKAILMVVGDGQDKDRLEAHVNKLSLCEHVTFIGTVQNDKIPDYLAAANVLVLPSLSEGFPVVLLEAMASGVPMVTTRVTGIPEIVEDGINGLIVEPKNSKQIAEKVLLLLQDNELDKEIIKNNKETIKKYDLNFTVKQLEKIYQNM